MMTNRTEDIKLKGKFTAKFQFEIRDCSEFLVRGGGVLLLGGVPISDEVSEGGYQNFTETPRGGYAFFTGTFPEKDHPPPYEKF